MGRYNLNNSYEDDFIFKDKVLFTVLLAGLGAVGYGVFLVGRWAWHQWS